MLGYAQVIVMEKKDKIILPLNIDQTNFFYRSSDLRSFQDEVNAFLEDIHFMKTRDFAYKVMFSQEVKSNNTIEGYLDDINLVAIITQNIKIVIPSKKEEIVDKTKININTCTIEELLTIPKIGITKANAIIAYRNANGSFTNIEELKEVDGIGDVIFEEIKVYITI